jgi:Arc/MetJ-type ribon-helix-helix transcriptional regulator
MLVSISAKISEEDKERIRVLVSKGAFNSMSDFYRTAIHRFLRELEEYQIKKQEALKEALGAKPEAPEADTDESDLKELQKFIDDLY